MTPDQADQPATGQEPAFQPAFQVAPPHAVAGALIFGQIMAAEALTDPDHKPAYDTIMTMIRGMVHAAMHDQDGMHVALEGIYVTAAHCVNAAMDPPAEALDPATADQYTPRIAMGRLEDDGTVTRVDPADVDAEGRWGHVHVVGGRVLMAVGLGDRPMLRGVLDGEYDGKSCTEAASFTVAVLWTMARTWHAVMDGHEVPEGEAPSVEVPDVPPADWSGHTPPASPDTVPEADRERPPRLVSAASIADGLCEHGRALAGPCRDCPCPVHGVVPAEACRVCWP